MSAAFLAAATHSGLDNWIGLGIGVAILIFMFVTLLNPDRF